MDTQIVTLNSSNSNIEMARNNISMVFPNRAQFYSSCQLQNFSMSDSIIFYISKNPKSAKLYQKLVQSCKHFFVKNPIIIVPQLRFFQDNGWYTLEKCPSMERPNERSVFLNKITSKIWITDSLNVWGNATNRPVVTSFMPKIYQCDATSINIYRQMFSFNDLMVIASKCEILYLSHVVIMNNDEIVPKTEENRFETAVSLEALFKALTNVKTFRHFLPDNSLNIVTKRTAEKLLKIPHFLSIDEFEIRGIPEIFDIKSFYGHIKDNKKTKIDLDFSSPISDEYKPQLQTIVDEILETENRDYKVPIIYFPEITRSSYRKMKTLYNQK